MAKAGKKPLVKVYTCKPSYLMESLFSPDRPNPTNFDKLIVDFSLSEEIARKCMRLKLDYVGCCESERKCIKLKKKLGFKDGYATGL